MVLINGISGDKVSVSDRGLQYGDGVFETIAYRGGSPEFLEQHITRLLNGCRILHINFGQIDHLRAELEGVFKTLDSDSTVIKITITRGVGGRGYFSDNSAIPTRIIATYSYPIYPEGYQVDGVTLRFCEQTLSVNRRLAGIKHMNRLEQVLARNEWSDPAIAEGIMSNEEGSIIECTMSNIFVVADNVLTTPLVTQAGIAGVMRGQIIQLATRNGISVEERAISRQQLAQADEVFICNSIIGVWPVSGITTTRYSVGFITQFIQKSLSELKK
jgi:4-amino-4-deoxychorismate lyase